MKILALTFVASMLLLPTWAAAAENLPPRVVRVVGTAERTISASIVVTFDLN